MGIPARVLGTSATLCSEKPFEGKKCLLLENKFISDDH